MSVRPEARDRGIAKGLTTAVLQRAQERGCHRVVHHSSAMAVEVYRRAGFVERCSLTVYATARIWSNHDH
jgi:ribosomal protein S18 acetylase RimI-like enzyme